MFVADPIGLTGSSSRRFPRARGFAASREQPCRDQGDRVRTRIAESPTLTILFNHPVSFNVRGGIEFQSLIVSVSNNGKACKPEFPGRARRGLDAIPEGETGVVARRQLPRKRWCQSGAERDPNPGCCSTEFPRQLAGFFREPARRRDRQADRGGPLSNEAKQQ